jgi:uncharacterized protein YodC (DUF2158 family)
LVPFQIGNVVSLKSGGLNMVVASVKESSVTCRWFQQNGTLNVEVFDIELIEKAKQTRLKRGT